jgi:ER membrane protein complex subunit 3
LTRFENFTFSIGNIQSLGAEKDSLDIMQHDWALPKMERHAEDVLKQLLKK